METTSLAYTGNSMQAQVASSKNIEWMVSSYFEWQQRSPLHGNPKRTLFSLLKSLRTKARK